MSALVQWWREIDDGKRSAVRPMDDLWARACRELNDEEFATEVTIPQRIYLAELKARKSSVTVGAITDGMDALERWRRTVLEADKRRSPLDVAAAWELTAAECERLGNHDAADEARAMARAQLKRSIA